ncbi:MAG: hypothetical protein HC876_19775 [Chloroflexaceae bacterium]|nr:hypothetical protein [Chloroflexaceae bacterium]NJO07569.1 hypothetical protein [Chloroflexaceae bacterium]
MNEYIAGTLALSMVPRGHCVRVVGVLISTAEGNRLRELGIVPNARLRVAHENGSSLLIEVGQAHVIVGRCMAHWVRVRFDPDISF